MGHFYLYEHRTRLNLAEYGIDAAELSKHLQQLWNARPRVPFWRAPDDDGSTKQRFLRFHVEDGTVSISARNYVGQIQIGDHTLHLLPKVFCPSVTKAEQPPAVPHLQAMHAQVFWWLSYAHKLRFPRSLANFAALPTNLLEVLILLFAQYTHDLLSRSHYQYYQEISEDLNTLRGRVNYTAYAGYYAVGHGHQLPCTFDSFQPDNRFNRILKYVVGQLLSLTRQEYTRRLLQDIRFMLDDVADQVVVFADCDQVHLSPLFEEFAVVLDYCRLFLAESGPLAAHKSEVRVFAVLLPTEVIFEEFIEGFVRTHLADRFNIQAQAQDLYLATAIPKGHTQPQRFFQLRHDLLLRPKRDAKLMISPLVIDTKYKPLQLDENCGIESGSIAQADMYQLISYALRRGAPYTYLFYPDSLCQPAIDAGANQLVYNIEDTLSGKASIITVAAHRLPIIVSNAFLTAESPTLTINKALTEQEQILKARLRSMLTFIDAE